MTRAKRPRKAAAKAAVDVANADVVPAEIVSAAPVWATVRTRYSEKARAAGDSATSTVTLRDLLALELAEHGRMSEEQGKADGKEVVSLLAARVQSRKALRTLQILVGPTGGPSVGNVSAVPEEYAGDNWYRRQAALRLRRDSEILE